MTWIWASAFAGEPERCRPADSLREAVRSVTPALRRCLEGASLPREGLSLTFAPEGTVTVQTHLDADRQRCAEEAVSTLRLAPADCTVIVRWPL